MRFNLGLFAAVDDVIAPGLVAALGVMVLVQYAISLRRASERRKESRRLRAEIRTLESEVQDVHRDRTLARLENQILCEVISQTELQKALGVVLRRCVPNPQSGFAVFLQLQDPADPPIVQMRGLSPESAHALHVNEALRESLRQKPAVVLEGAELDANPLFKLLAAVDRNKARRLFLVGVGEEELEGLLVSTALLPAAAPPEQQLELAARLMLSITGNLRNTLALQRQQSQLEYTQEMLELRSILDAPHESPLRMIEAFVSRLIDATEADRAALYLMNGDQATPPRPLLRTGCRLQVGVEAMWYGFEDRLAQQLLTPGAPIVMDVDELSRLGIRSLLGSAAVVPLVQNGRVMGCLCLTRQSNEPFEPVHRELLRWSCDYLAETILRVLSFAAIERQAREDGLTGLANRRVFDVQIRQEVSAAVQSGSECSLLLLDLDRFKSVNDTWGHPAGDEVLRVAASLLREQTAALRSSDRALLARYGGEELAVLLPGIGTSGALRLAEAIRAAVERTEIPVGVECIRVTLSIGVATCPQHAETADDLVAAADAALYQAKETGRNRAIAASQPVGNLAH